MEGTRITDCGALPLSALDSLIESAYVVSMQGRIPGMNKAAEDLTTGYPPLLSRLSMQRQHPRSCR